MKKAPTSNTFHTSAHGMEGLSQKLTQELQSALNVSVDMVDHIATQSIDFALVGDHGLAGGKHAPLVAPAHTQASATVYASHVLAAAIDGLAEQVRLLRSARPE
nr:hypothetical protein [uncultured Albidiferax sp.]